MLQATRAPNRPWYREPYVWLIILFPALAVIGGAVTLRLAVVSDDGLVTDDYYRKGLEINRVLERDERARALGVEADTAYDPAAHRLTIALRGNASFRLPPAARLRLMHATRAGLDRELSINPDADGRVELDLPPLAEGHWHLQVETAEWRVLRSLHVRNPAPAPRN